MKLQLFDYQATAADLMVTRDRFGLHDEMGIGKTATTMGAMDRLLATRLGSAGAQLVADGEFGVMVAARGEDTAAVPLAAGNSRLTRCCGLCRCSAS